MAEEHPPTVVVHNGNGIGRIVDAGRAVLAVVPPSFLGLVLLNMCFLGIILWFLNSQVEARMALVTKIIDACIVNTR